MRPSTEPAARDDMNWLPDDYRTPEASRPTSGDAPGSGELQSDGEPQSDGAGEVAASATGGPAAQSERTGGLPDLSPVAVVAGLVGLLTGPLLVGDPTARYVVLIADLVALAFGGMGVWVALKRVARLDYAIAAIVMGAVSLYLWISYVSDPSAGGT